MHWKAVLVFAVHFEMFSKSITEMQSLLANVSLEQSCCFLRTTEKRTEKELVMADRLLG